jgi:ribosomal protein S18 acetylase RimI-like enzyme
LAALLGTNASRRELATLSISRAVESEMDVLIQGARDDGSKAQIGALEPESGDVGRGREMEVVSRAPGDASEGRVEPPVAIRILLDLVEAGDSPVLRIDAAHAALEPALAALELTVLLAGLVLGADGCAEWAELDGDEVVGRGRGRARGVGRLDRVVRDETCRRRGVDKDLVRSALRTGKMRKSVD